MLLFCAVGRPFFCCSHRTDHVFQRKQWGAGNRRHSSHNLATQQPENRLQRYAIESILDKSPGNRPQPAIHHPPSIECCVWSPRLRPRRTEVSPGHTRQSPFLSTGDSTAGLFRVGLSRLDRAPARNGIKLDRVLPVPASCPVRDVCLTHS